MPRFAMGAGASIIERHARTPEKNISEPDNAHKRSHRTRYVFVNIT